MFRWAERGGTFSRLGLSILSASFDHRGTSVLVLQDHFYRFFEVFDYVIGLALPLFAVPLVFAGSVAGENENGIAANLLAHVNVIETVADDN